MIGLNILLGLAAVILFLFVVGETKPPISNEQRKNCTVAFVAVLVFIIALNTIM